MLDCDAGILITETDCESQYPQLVVLPGLYPTHIYSLGGSHTHRSRNYIVNHWRNTYSFTCHFFNFCFHRLTCACPMLPKSIKHITRYRWADLLWTAIRARLELIWSIFHCEILLPNHPLQPNHPLLRDHPLLPDHPPLPNHPLLRDHPPLPNHPRLPDHPPLPNHPLLPDHPPLPNHPPLQTNYRLYEKAIIILRWPPWIMHNKANFVYRLENPGGLKSPVFKSWKIY